MADHAQDFDLGVEGEASASPGVLNRLHKAIQDSIALSEGIEQMEEDAKAARAALHLMRSKVMPDLMVEARSEHFDHAGYDIKLTDFVSGSLPKEEVPRKKAMKWLEKNDGAELIKTEVSMAFGKSQHEDAMKVAKQMEKEGHPVSVSSGVNAQTLQSFARTRIREGKSIDAEVLGLFVGKIVKIKKLEK